MRILVLGAGGPAGVNALRALHRAGHSLVAQDDNAEHLAWCKPWAELYDDEVWEHFDLIIPQPDSMVLELAGRDDLVTFLPSKETVEFCQDKLLAAILLARAGLRDAPLMIEEPWPDHLHLAADRFGLPFWLRATRGAGAKGAIKVANLEQGFHWLRFWQSRGAGLQWMAEEFLPGRDLAWSSVWYEGELVTSFLRERLEYLYPNLTPEGLTGTPTIARIVHDNAVEETAEQTVWAIDSRPHGIFSVDLREDAAGVAKPTELNAGRGFTTFGLWSLFDPNFLDVAVRLPDSIGELPQHNALPDGLTLRRHIDCQAQFSQVAAWV